MELEIGRESEAKSIQKTDWTISSLLGRSCPTIITLLLLLHMSCYRAERTRLGR